MSMESYQAQHYFMGIIVSAEYVGRIDCKPRAHCPPKITNLLFQGTESTLREKRNTRLQNKVLTNFVNHLNLLKELPLKHCHTQTFLNIVLVTKHSRLKKHPKTINIIISQHQRNLVS